MTETARRPGIVTAILVISLILILLSCKDDRIRIVIKEKYQGFEAALSSVFGIVVQRENDVSYLVDGRQSRQYEWFLRLAPQVSIIFSIDGKKVERDSGNPVKLVIVIRYKDGMDLQVVRSFEELFSLAEKKYYPAMKLNSYTMNQFVSKETVMEYLRSLSFIQTVEENREYGIF